MERSAVYDLINAERAYQDSKWKDVDDKNTPNDWIAYITAYTGKAYSIPFNRDQFRQALVKVAALAVAALEREGYSNNSLEQ